MCIPTKVDSQSNPDLLEFHLDNSTTNNNHANNLAAEDRQSHLVDRKGEEEEEDHVVTSGRFHNTFLVFFCCFVLSLSIRMKNEANSLKLQHDRIKTIIRDMQTERIKRTRKKEERNGGLEYTMIGNWWENETTAIVTIITN